MTTVLSWIAFVFGGWLCLTNFYLTFLRYPLHRLRGFSKEDYRHISIAPVLGSGLVVLSWFLPHSHTEALLPAAITLIVIDTGGLHWFIGTIVFYWVYHKIPRW